MCLERKILNIYYKKEWNNGIWLGLGDNDVYKATIMVVGAIFENGWMAHE